MENITAEFIGRKTYTPGQCGEEELKNIAYLRTTF